MIVISHCTVLLYLKCLVSCFHIVEWAASVVNSWWTYCTRWRRIHVVVLGLQGRLINVSEDVAESRWSLCIFSGMHVDLVVTGFEYVLQYLVVDSKILEHRAGNPRPLVMAVKGRSCRSADTIDIVCESQRPIVILTMLYFPDLGILYIVSKFLVAG
jgi:hypothetical protein